MGMLKGILIDPFTKSVDEVFITPAPGRSFDDLYKHIGCSMVEFVYADHDGNGHPKVVVIVDEEGLFKQGQQFFTFSVEDAVSSPLAGKAVVLGLTTTPDANGETGDLCDCPLIPSEVLQRVTFCTTEQVRRFRDGGGFDTRITGLDDQNRPTGPTEVVPVRPALEGEDLHHKYGVICPDHGLVALTDDAYREQLYAVGDVWRCTICGRASKWDDDSLCMDEENES